MCISSSQKNTNVKFLIPTLGTDELEYGYKTEKETSCQGQSMLQPKAVQKGHFHPELNHNHPASPAGFTNSSIFTTLKQKNCVICHQRIQFENLMWSSDMKSFFFPTCIFCKKFFITESWRSKFGVFFPSKYDTCEVVCPRTVLQEHQMWPSHPNCSQGSVPALPAHLTGHL